MAGTSEDVKLRIKKNVLSWFGHVERMSAEKMAKKIYDGKVSGKRDRRRPRSTCMKRLMTMDEAKEVCRDRGVWHSVLADYSARDKA